MALAFLCKQLGSKCIIPNLSAKAFVVDHKAREESTEEAHKVAEWLKDLGRVIVFQFQASRLDYPLILLLMRSCRTPVGNPDPPMAPGDNPFPTSWFRKQIPDASLPSSRESLQV